MSDAFAYLSVLLSIILGLAIAEVLQGYGALLVERARVRLYLPPLIWSALMLLMATQFWWASFGLSRYEHWDFAAFSAVLLQTVMLYMGTTVVLPKARAEGPISLRDHYYREVQPFFSFGLLFLLVGFVKDWLLDRSMPSRFQLAFYVFFVVVTLIALRIRRPPVHEALAPIMAVAILLYFAMLFTRL